jgi:exonuclease SbcD
MKILHFADLHIGHETYGKNDPKTGLNSRLLDFLKSFDQVVDYTLKNNIDLVIFAGDAYKTRDPSPTYQREFSKRIKKIALKVPIVLITGNHDIPPSFGKADTLEIFPTLEVPNVYVLSKPTVKEIRGIQILALPWLSKSDLLKDEERKKSIEEIQTILSKRIEGIFLDLLEKINPQKPSLAIVHQSVSGATFSSNQGVYIGNDPLIPVSVLAHPKLSYIALGHLHKFQVLNENPPVIYSGSLERIDFGEENEKKGFVEVRIDESKSEKTKWKFIPLETRRFKTINIKIPEKEKSPNQYVLNQIKKAKIDNAIVRILIEGKQSALERIIDTDLRDITQKAYYLASISKKSEKEITKIEITGRQLGPMEWLSEYLNSKKIQKQDAKILKEAALKLMEEI